ncbi:hypothetical protein B0H14DRAFT_3164667 [Mycena olivaceomarginata]|nr:hypothetical protein B0H14DRAFT_3164667 [Mycena olivaceomarginata]
MSEIVSTEIVFGRGDERTAIALGFPLDTEFDEFVSPRIIKSTGFLKQIAFHFLLRLTEVDPSTGQTTTKSVGTIRGTTPGVYPAINRYKLSRLAIDKEYRKHKFGGLLVENLHRWIQEDAKTTNRPAEVECHYSCDGILCQGEQYFQYDEDSGPHQNMVVRLSLLE